ncbi:MAG: efflux RND transporter periplasmic adaptor subunit [Alphaproteobacteria bacterium]|nr:efflux RND transporter periplasmic adaptor subunit [Alphaproteobacteria bacterium]
MVMLAACDEAPSENGNPAGTATVPTVTVTVVARQPVTESFSFVGRIEAVDHVDIRARVQGFLEQRMFEEGEDVGVGDLLFLIEPEPFEAAVAQAEANLERAQAAIPLTERALARAEQLFSRGNVSEAALDDARAATEQARADVAAAEAELERARIDLSYTRIASPIAGQVSRSVYSVGNLVGPDSGVLTTVTSLDPIYATFSVSERDLVTFRRQRLEGGPDTTDIVLGLRLPDDSAYAQEGLIDYVDTQADPATGTVGVRGVFENPDSLLLPGQFVTVLLRGREPEQVLLVPQSAIQQDQAGRFVLGVDAENQVEVRRVQVSRQVDTAWVVEGGLSEGDLVITGGLQRIRPGVAVEPVFADTPAGE